MKKKNKKKNLSAEEKKRNREARIFRNKIKLMFINAGFNYINSNNIHFDVGLRTVEIDHICIYKNLLILCEDTTTNKRKDKDHIRNKNETITEIVKNKKEFIEKLSENFKEYEEYFLEYDFNDYIIFYLYFSQSELDLDDNEKELYSRIHFVKPKDLDYLYKITKCIKKSSRFEIYRFLGIDNTKIGHKSSESCIKKISAPIIYPEDYTGYKNGVRVVSFMMSAESLIKTSYVMRKDNWEDSLDLYQRLIDTKKIKDIRKYLLTKKTAFINNVIVGLPDNVMVETTDGKQIKINEWEQNEGKSILIPDISNSICIIDGQHRIYAHYEDVIRDRTEIQVSSLRKKLHLLVTGLIFPEKMNDLEKMQIQSELFLDINSNAKPVPADILLHIEKMKKPLSDLGIAKQVVEKLNKFSPFKNKFELSTLDSGKIKIASIIKFALRYLVTITPQEDKDNLYTYWEGDKKKLMEKDSDTLNSYVDFCCQYLQMYFSALYNKYSKEWSDNKSKILSVTSINGFIIALNRDIANSGLHTYDYYYQAFSKSNFDFSKQGFRYTSSQYRMFSDEIIKLF